MNVKELISILSQYDPETEVMGMVTDLTDWTYKLDIQSVEFDSPHDDGSVDFKDEDYDEDGEYVGPKVVLINLGVV